MSMFLSQGVTSGAAGEGAWGPGTGGVQRGLGGLTPAILHQGRDFPAHWRSGCLVAHLWPSCLVAGHWFLSPRFQWLQQPGELLFPPALWP